MLETIAIMATAIMGAVEALKSTLLQFDWFKNLTQLQQSLLLQVIAWALGALAGFAYQINALATVPAFMDVPATVGYVVTGLVAGTGSAGIHIIFALLGVRASVTAQTVAKEEGATKAQAAGTLASVRDVTYAPWS